MIEILKSSQIVLGINFKLFSIDFNGTLKYFENILKQNFFNIFKYFSCDVSECRV